MKKNRLFTCLQKFLPQHLLSRMVGYLARSRVRWIKNSFIRFIIWRFEIDLSEAVQTDPFVYENFNDFFTRRLRPEARPIAPGAQGVVSPADGTISAFGEISDGRIFQAKGFDFSCVELLGGDETLAQQFANGQFMTVYLAPKDYHRVHMPISGQLQKMIYVPGKLFSVNKASVENIPRLFARNERVICVFSTAIGPVVVILVGAMIVASIQTVWGGQVAPQRSQQIQHWDYQDSDISLEKGAELGLFAMGSTVITLFPKQALQFQSLTAQTPLKMGQLIAQIYP
jgi:phosphatidylserine decarboxylase